MQGLFAREEPWMWQSDQGRCRQSLLGPFTSWVGRLQATFTTDTVLSRPVNYFLTPITWTKQNRLSLTHQRLNPRYSSFHHGW